MLKTESLIKDIRKELEVKNGIKYRIITLREYADPRTIQSRNPILRLIKKTFLFLFGPLIKSQIIFNKNSLSLYEGLYKYINYLENKIKSLEKKQK